MEEKAVYTTEILEATPDKTDLDAEIRNLVEIRNRLADIRQGLDTARANLEATPEYRVVHEFEGMVSDLKDMEQAQMVLVRRMAVREYSETRQKSIRPGIGIRVTKNLDYKKEDVKDWVLSHLPTAVTVDVPLFEKYALAVADTAPVPGVAVVETPTATIAARLPGQI